ncbi:hypothetical protein [Fulvivirga sediminis]|uniref:Uncharacterized protein n=1 Tax=Fulvivirga sediminis TaxID=2803949 RepID=A0A937F3H3_9BACT|nr:hypothetical protein [Fulvivirga sediminis]MBL3655652.1 hypothetical protein [Fulvivirga sediminis]
MKKINLIYVLSNLLAHAKHNFAQSFKYIHFTHYSSCLPFSHFPLVCDKLFSAQRPTLTG